MSWNRTHCLWLMDPYPDPSLPRLNGGRLKRRAAPRMASAALAAERPRARAGAAGAAGRVNRCQHSTPDRVSRLTPPVSRHDRPKSYQSQTTFKGAKTIQMCPIEKTMFLQSASKETTQNVANIPLLSKADSSSLCCRSLSVPSYINLVLRSEADLYPT